MGKVGVAAPGCGLAGGWVSGSGGRRCFGGPGARGSAAAAVDADDDGDDGASAAAAVCSAVMRQRPR